MVVCTIDPGLVYAAYSIFDDNGKILESETIKFNTKLSQCVRLNLLYCTLIELIKKYPITDVITEYQFVDIMSSIVGVIMAGTGSEPKLKFDKITPSQWKKLAFGKGNIEESELRNKIIDIYKEAEEYSEHQLDTIGIFLGYKEKLLNPPIKTKKPKKEKKEESNVNVSKSTKRSPKKQKSS